MVILFLSSQNPLKGIVLLTALRYRVVTYLWQLREFNNWQGFEPRTISPNSLLGLIIRFVSSTYNRLWLEEDFVKKCYLYILMEQECSLQMKKNCQEFLNKTQQCPMYF